MIDNDGGQMNEKPLLYKGQMVKAVLDDSKTETRRVIDWQRLHKQAGLPFPTKCKLAHYSLIDQWGIDAGDGVLREVKCPYGDAGDQLWVRETLHNDDGDWIYAADSTPLLSDEHKDWQQANGHKGYIPSIHTFRWMSRIDLLIKSIRVERVCDITEAGAKAEGVEAQHDPSYPPDTTYKFAFANLWQEINGKPRADGTDISWYANPFVWVIKFERIRP